MFKSVEYAGFEGRDDLRRLAEGAMPVLTDEVSRLREDVSVRWVNGNNPLAPLILELTLELGGDVAGASSTLLSDDLADPDRIRVRCRRAWLRVLDQFIDDRLDTIRESWKQPVGA